MSIDWRPTGSARKITAKEQGNRGFFPSSKVNGGIVEYESTLERDIFLNSNHAQDVISFQHQPITVSYLSKDGKRKKYTPDIFIEFKNGKKIIAEIKYKSEVDEKYEKYQERWEHAYIWGKERNITFLVLTEEEIRTPRWYNVWFTLGASKCADSDIYTPKFLNLIPNEGEKYSNLCYCLAESEGLEINKAAQIVCYAIYHGLVFVDTFSTKNLSNTTIIRHKKLKSSSAFKPLWDEFTDINSKIFKHEIVIQDSEKILNTTNNFESFAFRIPAHYESIVNKRAKVVKLWLKQPKSNRTPEWKANFCKKWEISERSIYYWVQLYRKGGIENLIPKYCKSGRHSIYELELLKLLENSRQDYFKPLNTLKKVYRELVETCTKNNIQPPKESSLKTFIHRNSTASDFARKRGKKYHKSNFTPSLASFQGAFAPMQILQLDNTNFDVFPVDSEFREGLSTPYMTAAIDCYTRMITGFSISYFPSSSRTVLDVLIQSILPKENIIETFCPQSNWPIQGFPVLILVDNGMDYRAKIVKDFCMKYDIILEFAPIRTPRYKAFIEQWFNILHHALATENVEGWRPLLKHRLENPELKPEAEAILTLQEIEEWMYKWILDEYHFTNPYENHVPAPFLRWQNYQEIQTDVILPAPREPPKDKNEIDEIYLSMLIPIERILGYNGVIWERLSYHNPQLMKEYNQNGKQKVKVLINNRDIRFVWVIISNQTEPIKVELASGWAQAIVKIYGNMPIHASAWINDLKRINSKLRSHISPYVWQKEISRIKRDELIQIAKKSTKLMRKEHEKMKETKRKSKFHHEDSYMKPEKKQPQESLKPKYKAEDIDWDNLPILWTDDFYSGD